MKKVSFLLAVLIAFTSFAVPAKAQTVSAKGSSRAITLSWDSIDPTAAFYQVRRIKPSVSMVTPGPVDGTSWVDTLPETGTNTYEISALDSSLNQTKSIQVSSQTDKNVPTLEAPCYSILSFATGSKTFTDNGTKKQMTAAPVLKSGKMYLVIRYVVEPLGGTIGFDKATSKVTISALGHTVEMWIGKSMAKVDGVDKPIDAANPKVAPFIEGGRTYVPLRFPVESLGRGSIDWFAKEKTAVLVFPLGCADTIEGQISSVSGDKVTVSFGEGTGDFTIPQGVKLQSGQCVGVSYEEVDGKNFTGQIVKVPCSQCTGEQFNGTVISSSDTLIIKDAAGKARTFKKGKNITNFTPGTCVTGCASGDTVVALRTSDCPKQVFEGKVVTACSNGEFGFSVGGVSVQVKTPNGFDCLKLSVGACLVVEGNYDSTNSSLIVASKISIVECQVGSLYTVFVQSSCKNGSMTVADIDGNFYNLTVPTGTACDFQLGSCLSVTAQVQGETMVATKISQSQPPKDASSYFKGFITDSTAAKVTVAGDRTYNLTKPTYFTLKLEAGAAVEIWGRIKGESLNAVKLSVTPGMSKTVEGRIIDLMCQTRMSIVSTNSSKVGVKFPSDYDCNKLSIGECIKVVGIMDAETLQAGIVNKTDCPSGCTGKTYKGTITGVDCTTNTIKIRTFEENQVISVRIGSTAKCDTLYKGLCIAVCGELTGETLIAQTLTLTDCPMDVCEGKIFNAIIQSIDCSANTITIATKDGGKTLSLPDTVECSRLASGSCVEVCVVGESASYVLRLNCTALGKIIEGTMISETQVELTDSTKLTIKSNKKLSIGDCIVASGKMSDMEADVFEAAIIAVVQCSGGSGVSGKIESIDCQNMKVTVSTPTGSKEFSMPEGFDCTQLQPGDCLFVKASEGKTIINKINCPDYERMHTAVYVTSTASDKFTGTVLSSLSSVTVFGSYNNISKGSIYVAEGHRLNSSTMENAYIEPLMYGMAAPKNETMLFVSFDKTSNVARMKDAMGNIRLLVVAPEALKDAKKDEVFTLETTVCDTGFGPRAELGGNFVETSSELFNRKTVVGVIFGVDKSDDMVLMHTYEGENVGISPDDVSVIKSVRAGDCLIATGAFDDQSMILKNAKLDVSDCSGGELGRSFTGVITAIEGTKGIIYVASDTGSTYVVYTEAVTQLTGLSMGDCVAVSGIILSKQTPDYVLSKMIQRIDCQSPSNQPATVEGYVEDYTAATKQLKIKTFAGPTWTVFVEMNEIPNLEKGMAVRASGRLQAKSYSISKGYVSKMVIASARWSVSGKVTEKLDGAFKLTDGSGRNWTLHGQTTPEVDQTIFAVGIVPTFGLAELTDVYWTVTNGWQEPKSSFGGVVFGVSCGNDNLLTRNNQTQMTSLRLPHTGFCGFFAVGECVSANGRLQGTIPGMAKITEVVGNQNSCFEAAVVGKIVARSTFEKYSIMITTEGKLIRLGYETEVEANKLVIGDYAKINGKYMPSSPDTLKVENLTKIGGNIAYETVGRIIGVSQTTIIIMESSGRQLEVGLPDGYSHPTGLVSRYVSVKGQFESGVFKAKSVVVTKYPTVAVEIEGTVVRKTDHSIVVKDYQNGLWQVSVSVNDNVKVDDKVFVAGWSDAMTWWTITDAVVIKTSGQTPTLNLMLWGQVTGKDCDKGSVTITIDDGSKFDAYPSDKGLCDTVTVGEKILVSGQVQNGMTNTINGVRIARPGMSGDKKMIVGAIKEISCTSRVAKIQENDTGGIAGQLWTVKLDKSVNCESFTVGQQVRATGDLVLTQKLTLEDAVMEKIGSPTEQVTVTGSLVAHDCDQGYVIINSQGKLYRVYLSDNTTCTQLTSGDQLEVSGTINIGRKTVITDASWKKIPDTEAYTVLHARVDFAGCTGMRVLVLDGNEFWTINFKDGEPCDKIVSGMVLTFKGKKDPSRTHLLMQAIVLESLLPKVSVGTIDDIICDQGKLILVEDSGGTRTVNIETSVSECISKQFAKGDKVQVNGFLDILNPNSEIQFGKIEPFGDKLGLVPMDFVGEILDMFDCRGKGLIQARSGHVVWRLKLPDGSNCSDYKIGDWFRIKGGMQSFKDKTMIATSLEKAKATIIGYVSEANYSIPQLSVKELKKEYKWTVQLSDKSTTRNWKKGQYVIVEGDITGNMLLTNSVVTGMIMAKGKVKTIDPATQSIELEGDDLRSYTIKVKTDWIDLTNFKVGNVVTAVGVLEGKDLKKEGNVMKDCYVEESSGLPPPPFIIAPTNYGSNRIFTDIHEPKIN